MLVFTTVRLQSAMLGETSLPLRTALLFSFFFSITQCEQIIQIIGIIIIVYWYACFFGLRYLHFVLEWWSFQIPRKAITGTTQIQQYRTPNCHAFNKRMDLWVFLFYRSSGSRIKYKKKRSTTKWYINDPMTASGSHKHREPNVLNTTKNISLDVILSSA